MEHNKKVNVIYQHSSACPRRRVQPRGPGIKGSVFLDYSEPYGKVYWDVEVDGEANGGDGISVGVAQTRAGLGDEATFHSSEAAMLFHVHGGMHAACVCVMMGPSGVVHQHKGVCSGMLLKRRFIHDER